MPKAKLAAALVVLWVGWKVVGPSKFAQRVDQAVTMAAACNAAGAQQELAQLRQDGAGARDLRRVVQALEKAKPACERGPVRRPKRRPREQQAE
ncbi:MAG: hypothetical protein ACXU8N_12880 [Telluria sp.]